MTQTDTLDIELSIDDFETLDAAQLKQVHDKLRRSRHHMAEERKQYKERLEAERDALQRMTALAKSMHEQCRERDARLSRVAMALIDKGALDSMLLAKEED